MIPNLSQEIMTQYASDAQTIQEPQGLDFYQGVRVGKTVPAKWWNWLFSSVTKRIVQSRNDADNILTELNNTITDAGITPSATDWTQLGAAVDHKALAQIHNYVEAKKGYFTTWKPVPFPDVMLPSGYAWLSFEYFAGPNIVARYAYRSADPALTSDFYFAFNVDGLQWIVSDAIHMQSPVYASRLFTRFISRLGDRWFLLIGGLTDVSYQNSTFHELFVSDDLIHWTSVRTMSQSYSAGIVTVKPNMFVAYGTLYVMTSEGTQQSTTKYVYSTNNGYDWNAQVLSFEYASKAIYDKYSLPWLLGDGKFIIGNIFFDGSAFSLLFGAIGQTYYLHFQFGDGTVMYSDYVPELSGGTPNVVYKAAYPGAAAQAESLTDNIFVYTAQSFNGVAVLKAGELYGESQRGYVTVDSALTIHDITLPGAYINTTELIVRQGTAYFARYKSTDLSTWTELAGAPPDVSPSQFYRLFSTADPSVLNFYLYGGTSGYVTKDFGITWVQEDSLRKGTMLVGDVCFDSSGYATENSVNRVAGHTLYLR